MKRFIIFAGVGLAVLLGSLTEAHATEVGSARPFGLGFAVGSPSSLVAKYFLNRNNAIDFGLGFWRYGRRNCYRNDTRYDCDRFGRVGVNADYLWQESLATGSARLDWHIGVGGRIWFNDDYYDDEFALLARMPVGLDLTFNRPEFLEVYMEIAPALFVVPFVDLDFEAAIGVRFYF